MFLDTSLLSLQEGKPSAYRPLKQTSVSAAAFFAAHSRTGIHLSSNMHDSFLPTQPEMLKIVKESKWPASFLCVTLHFPFQVIDTGYPQTPLRCPASKQVFFSEAVSIFLSSSYLMIESSSQYVFIASLVLPTLRSFAEGKAAETGPATQQLPLESPPLKIHMVCRRTDRLPDPPLASLPWCWPVAREGAAMKQVHQRRACTPSSALLFLQQQLESIWRFEVCCGSLCKGNAGLS